MTAHAAGAPTRRAPTLFTLIAVSGVSPLAINIIVPSMPAIRDAFTTSYGLVQLTLSLFLASIAVSQIFLGPLSDRFGRRPVLLSGLAIFVLASFAAPFAPSIGALIAIRILQAAGGCAGIVLGRAVIRDLYERRRAASMIGYVTTGLAVAPMLGVIVGGFLQESYGWTASFWFTGMAALVVTLLAWVDLGETNHNRSERIALGTMLRDFSSLLGDRTYLLFMLVSSLSSGVFFSFLGGAPLVAENVLGLSPATYGLYFALVAGGYSLGNFASGLYSERFGLKSMIVAGAALLVVVALVVIALFALDRGSAWALFGPMFFGGIANGLTLPSTTAGAISTRPDIAGAAAGLLGAFQIGAGALLSALVGVLIGAGESAMPMLLVMGTAGILALVFALKVPRLG